MRTFGAAAWWACKAEDAQVVGRRATGLVVHAGVACEAEKAGAVEDRDAGVHGGVAVENHAPGLVLHAGIACQAAKGGAIDEHDAGVHRGIAVEDHPTGLVLHAEGSQDSAENIQTSSIFKGLPEELQETPCERSRALGSCSSQRLEGARRWRGCRAGWTGHSSQEHRGLSWSFTEASFVSVACETTRVLERRQQGCRCATLGLLSICSRHSRLGFNYMSRLRRQAVESTVSAVPLEALDSCGFLCFGCCFHFPVCAGIGSSHADTQGRLCSCVASAPASKTRNSRNLGTVRVHIQVACILAN